MKKKKHTQLTALEVSEKLNKLNIELTKIGKSY
jgi:hypothetical protein